MNTTILLGFLAFFLLMYFLLYKKSLFSYSPFNTPFTMELSFSYSPFNTPFTMELSFSIKNGE